MFIAVKDTKIISIHELEWMCRMEVKQIEISEYWTWLESITTEGVPDYSGEDYEIIKVDSDVNTVRTNFKQDGYIIHQNYFLKWDASKKEIVKDDTAKAAWELAEEWKEIRKQRTRLLLESDWTQSGDSPLTTQKKSDWAKYRTSLRTLPEDQSSETKYSDITWPTKPS